MTEKTTELSKIYTPSSAHVVLEIMIPTKTKGGVILSDTVRDQLVKKLNPALKVVAVGPDVKSVKVNDWVLPNTHAMGNHIRLVHKDPQGSLAHYQFHETEILGIVNTEFAEANHLENQTLTV